MKILFIGGTKRGYLTLRALIDRGASVCGVISLMQDEHETERFEDPIRNLAEAAGVPHYQTKWLKDRDYADLIANEIRPDVAFVVGCRILLPKSIYGLPTLGSLAVHDSLLPEYRGFAPLNWALINGERETGVTLFYLGERMDGGDIVAQRRVPMSFADSAPDVYERICAETVGLVGEACALLAEGRAPRIAQDWPSGSYTCSRTPVDGMIDWNLPTTRIYNLIRALTYPYPGAFTFFEGQKLFIWKATVETDGRKYVGRVPGRVIDISSSEGHVDILTGDGVLRILEVQREGQARVPAAVVIKSVKSTLGINAQDLLARLDAMEQQLQKMSSEKRATRAEGEA